MFSPALAAPPLVTTGASFTFVMASANVSATLKFPLSVAVTLRLTVPTCASSGVPLNVRVVALKLSHPGKALPSAFVAA